jgi:hypothetical protein
MPAAALTFRQLDPPAVLKAETAAKPEEWERRLENLRNSTVAELQEENAHWLREPMSLDTAVAMVWAINLEFTRRGVAPRWRNALEFLHVRPWEMASPVPPTIPPVGRPLGNGMRLKLLLRWTDLEWLRAELGPEHQATFRPWRSLFHAPAFGGAYRVFKQINRVRSNRGQPEIPQAWRVINALNVPSLHRRALTGLIDRDAGERATNAEKRVRKRYRPALEELMKRKRYPLTQDQVDRRVQQCLAIDLADGRITDAAKVLGWMTGKPVTRQSMHEAKLKIVEQCGFNTKVWR